MKTVRGYEHDLQAIEALHRLSPLSLGVLVARYEQEMGSVVADPRRLRGNVLAVVERLFPEQAEAVAKGRSPWEGLLPGDPDRSRDR